MLPILTPILNIVLKQLEELSSFFSFLFYIPWLEDSPDHKYLASTFLFSSVRWLHIEMYQNIRLTLTTVI